MAVIKGGERREDIWREWIVGDPMPSEGPLLVDSPVWAAERDRLLAHDGQVGIRLVGDGLVGDGGLGPVAADLDRLSLIVLHFEAFTDGRAFSHARRLRQRGFKGEIRAGGAFLRDQAFFLARCGVDAFEVADDEPLASWQAALAAYTLAYQPAADGKGRRTSARARAPVGTSTHEATALSLLREMIRDVYPGRVAVVSSFGAESAVLLDLVARVDRATPVILLETGKHFPETLVYRDALVAHLGLTDIRSVSPDPSAVAREDAHGTLWVRDADRCCALRKVGPLSQALRGFDAWISGVKRFQGGERGTLSRVQAEGGRTKINPLARWSEAEIAAAFGRRGLPRHPLSARGYRSIGCAPCTAPADAGGGSRDGRWSGTQKTECGIHRAAKAGS